MSGSRQWPRARAAHHRYYDIIVICVNHGDVGFAGSRTGAARSGGGLEIGCHSREHCQRCLVLLCTDAIDGRTTDLAHQVGQLGIGGDTAGRQRMRCFGRDPTAADQVREDLLKADGVHGPEWPQRFGQRLHGAWLVTEQLQRLPVPPLEPVLSEGPLEAVIDEPVNALESVANWLHNDNYMSYAMDLSRIERAMVTVRRRQTRRRRADAGLKLATATGGRLTMRPVSNRTPRRPIWHEQADLACDDVRRRLHRWPESAPVRGVRFAANSLTFCRSSRWPN